MVRSVELSEAIQAIADLGLLYRMSGEEIIVSHATQSFPAGVEIFSLRQDMLGFGKARDFEAIGTSGEIPESWKGLPTAVLDYLSRLDSLGLRLVARKDVMEFAEVIYIATDGFIGGETLGGEGGDIPRLVLVFDINGEPKKWGVYGPKF